MRLTIAAVGRSRESPEQALCEFYCDRARGLAPKLGFSRLDLVVIDISRAASADARMTDEAEKLANKLPPGAHRIALDEAGRTMTSEGHRRAARDIGIAERTPKTRAS